MGRIIIISTDSMPTEHAKSLLPSFISILRGGMVLDDAEPPSILDGLSLHPWSVPYLIMADGFETAGRKRRKFEEQRLQVLQPNFKPNAHWWDSQLTKD